MAKALDPNELIEVVWNDTKQKVNVPRRLISNANKGALERYLKSSGQLLPDPVPTSSEEPEVIIEEVQSNGAIDALSARLTAVENRPEPVSPPSEEALTKWAAQAARVSLVHSEMAALADQTVATCEGAATAANQRLDQLDSQQSAMVEAVSETLSTVKDESNATVLAAQAELAGFMLTTEESALAKAEEIAAKQRGPKGSAGIASVTCTEDPISADETWNTRWLGRNPMIGDTAWVVSSDGITFRRFISGGWSPDAPELNPKVEVVSKKLAIQDASTKVSSIQNITHIKMSSGGSTPLATQLVNGVALNAARQRIGDGAAYGAELERTNQYARACEVLLRVTALDGPNAGKSDYARYDLLVEDNSAASETISAMLGTLGIGISLRLIPAGSGSVPAWAPAGATASATHTPVIELLVDSNTTGATQLAVEGSINWVLPTDGGQPLKAGW